MLFVLDGFELKKYKVVLKGLIGVCGRIELLKKSNDTVVNIVAFAEREVFKLGSE